MRRIRRHEIDGLLHVRASRFHLEWGTDDLEQEDGAIIGTVNLAITTGKNTQYRKITTFRIEPDGRLTDGPEWLRKFAEAE